MTAEIKEQTAAQRVRDFLSELDALKKKYQIDLLPYKKQYNLGPEILGIDCLPIPDSTNGNGQNGSSLP